MVLRVGEEVVLINDCRHRHLACGTATFHAYHAALAAHTDALRQRDLGRQGQREVDRGDGLDGGIDIETTSARATVARLLRMLQLCLADTTAARRTTRARTCW